VHLLHRLYGVDAPVGPYVAYGLRSGKALGIQYTV